MNLKESFWTDVGATFRASRALRYLLPRQTISAFGLDSDLIQRILVINLERQPKRWKRLLRELDRYRTQNGTSLVEIAEKLSAIDARDSREIAPTADVDPIYRMADQLFVQPDDRLLECFGPDEPIRMTPQEIAVARSHIEAWKRVANGTDEHTLILEDDVYFTTGAAQHFNRGWRAIGRDAQGSPSFDLLYVSFLDAGGTAERSDVSQDLFRPVRGFWYLSGYVLSRRGAQRLLRSMPVVGPVDLWINQQFVRLEVQALSKSVLLQRPDSGSDNAYSILPYLSRAGIVDFGPKPMRVSSQRKALVFAWNAGVSTDSMGMALSMLGYRVRTFTKDDALIDVRTVDSGAQHFDAFVDAKLDPAIVRLLMQRRPPARFVFAKQSPNDKTSSQREVALQTIPSEHFAIVTTEENRNPWAQLCHLLDQPVPNHVFPRGASHDVGLFQIDVDIGSRKPAFTERRDTSPWVLPVEYSDLAVQSDKPADTRKLGKSTIHADLRKPSSAFRTMHETFPGNMAVFNHDAVNYSDNGAALNLSESNGTIRPLQSGALASSDVFLYGRFEANIVVARGAGLITGFFLHRELPRQEIDIEFLGADPRRMLVNVYFNPGEEGTALGYGYRGTPQIIDLWFDASADFHSYALEWTPAAIRWFVDGQLVCERLRWDPTPIPHLPMRLYSNLWSPRSIELAGQLSSNALPATSIFKQIVVRENSSLEMARGSARTVAELVHR